MSLIEMVAAGHLPLICRRKSDFNSHSSSAELCDTCRQSEGLECMAEGDHGVVLHGVT